MHFKKNRLRKLLDLPEMATMDEIRPDQRRVPAVWHPDRCREEPSALAEVTRRIIDTQRTLLNEHALITIRVQRRGEPKPIARGLVIRAL